MKRWKVIIPGHRTVIRKAWHGSTALAERATALGVKLSDVRSAKVVEVEPITIS